MAHCNFDRQSLLCFAFVFCLFVFVFVCFFFVLFFACLFVYFYIRYKISNLGCPFNTNLRLGTYREKSKEYVTNKSRNSHNRLREGGVKISSKDVRDIFARNYQKNRFIIKRMLLYYSYLQLYSQLKQTIIFRRDKKKLAIEVSWLFLNWCSTLNTLKWLGHSW